MVLTTACQGFERKWSRSPILTSFEKAANDTTQLFFRPRDLNDEVAGKVFQITAAELAAADAYEVSDYKRIEVALKSGISAWVYVKT